MYYNHNVRTNLQEWKSRLNKATYEQFGHQLKYCVSNIEKNKLIFSLINEAVLQYPYSQEQLQEISGYEYGTPDMSFENEIHHSSYCYQILKHYIKECDSYNLHQFDILNGSNFDDKKKNIVEELITPIFYYLHDKLDKSNSVIYLLEKIKDEQNGLITTIY